jgi:DNA-directed RNA polymerase specialized sigma24 family protein
MTQPGPSAVEQARQAWHRALEETHSSLASARDQAEAELRRRWSLLRDAVEQALAAGMSLEDVARRLGLPTGVIDALLNRDSGPLPA